MTADENFRKSLMVLLDGAAQLRIELKRTEPPEQVCRECGSREVQGVVWMGLNTEEVVEDYGGGGDDRSWCAGCERHGTAVLAPAKKEETDEC